MRRYLFPGLLICLIGLGPIQAVPATPIDNARQFIQELGEQALKLLSDRSKPMTEREASFRELLRQNIDLGTIGQFVLGKEWRMASPEEREEYLALFSTWALETYSRLLATYEGGNFKISSAQPVGQRDILVTTEVLPPSGQRIKAGWRVRPQDDGFKIIDVVVEGASMAATQRSEFDTIIRRQGLAGLIETLRAKVSSFSARPS